MKSLNREESKLKLAIQILILITGLAFSFMSCKSPESTNTDEDTTTVARIIISNKYGESLDIYMDTIFQFMIENKNQGTIDNVPLKEHKLEAYKAGTNLLAGATTIDVTSKTDYTWEIDDPPDINVINAYGETLKIYMDDVYCFSIVDEENRWLIDVPFGERFLRATRSRDDTEVASTTVNVTENKDYSWTIQ